MSEQIHGQIDWDAIQRLGGSYPREAYDFVREGLTFTAEVVFGEGDLGDFDRHVSGQELCLGLKNYAVEQWGMMAPVVLECWGIRTSLDFGKIVFAMIEGGLMSRRPDDRLEDFAGVFDFREAFSSRELVAHIGECGPV